MLPITNIFQWNGCIAPIYCVQDSSHKLIIFCTIHCIRGGYHSSTNLYRGSSVTGQPATKSCCRHRQCSIPCSRHGNSEHVSAHKHSHISKISVIKQILNETSCIARSPLCLDIRNYSLTLNQIIADVQFREQQARAQVTYFCDTTHNDNSIWHTMKSHSNWFSSISAQFFYYH